MFVIPYSLEDKIFLYQISKKLASSYTRGLLGLLVLGMAFCRLQDICSITFEIMNGKF